MQEEKTRRGIELRIFCSLFEATRVFSYLRTVRMNRVHLFTLIQAICVIILLVLRYTAAVAIGFPLMVRARAAYRQSTAAVGRFEFFISARAAAATIFSSSLWPCYERSSSSASSPPTSCFRLTTSCRRRERSSSRRRDRARRVKTCARPAQAPTCFSRSRHKHELERRHRRRRTMSSF